MKKRSEKVNAVGLKIKVNKKLNKYRNVELFPEKVAKANEILRTVGLPKI
jgi:hypothetical protein